MITFRKKEVAFATNLLNRTTTGLFSNLTFINRRAVTLLVSIFLLGTINLFAQVQINNKKEWIDWATLGAPPDAILMADIGSPSDPVTTMVNPFTGTFDGNGHTVYVNINSNGPQYVGLFNRISGGAVIKNLTVTGNVKSNSSYQQTAVGGIVGVVRSSTIQNCINRASIRGEGGLAKYFLGGIVGFVLPNQTGIIEDCVNEGEITAYQVFSIGGIIGGAGEIGSPANNLIIRRCKNFANIIENATDVGGICGRIISPFVTVEDCINNGDVISSGDHIGGIASCLFHNKGCVATFTNCINNGRIQGGVSGGMIGHIEPNVNATFTNCGNTGTILGGHTGGFVGYISKGAVVDFIDNINRGGVVGM